MFEGIKSKLGFGSDADDYGARGYDARYEQSSDDYDDYDDYDDEAYDDEDDDALDGPVTGSRYEPYSTVTTRPSRTSSYSSSSSTRSYSTSSPRLVSIDDVRAQTQVPESLLRDPLPQRRTSSSASSSPSSSAGIHRGERTMVDSSDPTRPPATTSSSPSPRERSESLNALFTPTAAPSTAASAFDPYEAYAGSGSTKHDPTRSLTVIKPISYGEAERIAKALKAGDIVVLALATTPEALSKRLLDFSFGVASALDASVGCIADKVFVLTRNGDITEAEKASLRKMNVL